MNSINIVKGMTKEEVNNLVGKWIMLEDDVYLGSKYKHTWRCECGNVFQRNWSHIKHRKSILCEKCAYKPRRNITIDKYKKIIKNFNTSTYVRMYFKGDTLINGDIIKTNKVYIGLKHKLCNNEFDIRADKLIDDDKICPHCNPYLRIPNENESLGHMFPELSKIIVSDKFGKKIDVFKIFPYSNMYAIVRCPECNTLSNKAISINQITTHGYSCPICSDGLNIPEKFVSVLLNKLSILSVREVSKTTLSWCKNYRYDFYIPSLNMIIETHGVQHMKHTGFARSLKDEQENDRLKRELALNNGINKYIEIDCRKSELSWLRDNVTKELDEYIDLSCVDWDRVWMDTQKSKVIEVWDLWNEGLSVVKICKKLNLGKTTVRRYLHRGNSIGYCKYRPLDIYQISFISPDGEVFIFKNQGDFLKYINISQNSYYKYISDRIDINNLISLGASDCIVEKLKPYDKYKILFNGG